MAYSVILAGSTAHTVLIAATLLADARFEITHLITPAPKAVGRKQTLTKNPLHTFAITHHLPVTLVTDKLTTDLKTNLPATADFLLVVDFGYYVPSWLLAMAHIQPLNIHPSKLPRWRGSSPGQFALLYGDQPSAVSLITVAKNLDQGAIWQQIEFAVDPTWNAADYYHHAFTQIARDLPATLASIAAGTATPVPQPIDSPTPQARKITKMDSFVPWSVWQVVLGSVSGLSTALVDVATTNIEPAPLLSSLLATTPPTQWSLLLSRAVKALSPWPKVWTLVPTHKGQKRLVIHQTQRTQNQLQLTLVQLEGQSPAMYHQIKNGLLSE